MAIANNTVMIVHTVPTLVAIKMIWICLFSWQYFCIIIFTHKWCYREHLRSNEYFFLTPKSVLLYIHLVVNYKMSLQLKMKIYRTVQATSFL